MKKRRGSATLYLILFITIILAFCAFAVDGTIIYTARAELQSATNATALAVGAEFKPNDTFFNKETLKEDANNIFKAQSVGLLKYAKIEKAYVNGNAKMVKLKTSCNTPTFFLGLLGVSVVKINAVATAKAEELDSTSSYGNVSWVNASTAYFTDVISGDFSDTAVLLPLGSSEDRLIGASFSKVNGSVAVDYSLINNNYLDQPLSLGDGGYVTLRLPAPVINKPGPDIYIGESGVKEGYVVFAGTDTDSKNPYQNSKKPGGGITWVNISCAGVPKETNFTDAVQDINGASKLSGKKFYGSGYFDIGNSCISGETDSISVVKYLKIFDDNVEDCYTTPTLNDDSVYHLFKIYGEASTATPGADINYVSVLNNTRLVPSDTYVIDTNDSSENDAND